MGFNSAFKGLINVVVNFLDHFWGITASSLSSRV